MGPTIKTELPKTASLLVHKTFTSIKLRVAIHCFSFIRWETSTLYLKTNTQMQIK